MVGVGRIKEIGALTEYVREGKGMRGMLWERPVQHSIRPKQDDGFLIPYLEILRKVEEDPTIDLSRYVAHAPSEHWNEFSFASELVTHDGGIGALLSISGTLTRIKSELGIETGRQLQWVHDELVRLWKVRGPYPGLGAVLRAFGLSQGLFVAHALQEKAGLNADPWPLVDKAFTTPSAVLPKDLHRDLKELGSTWTQLPEQRRKVLKLISRFELTVDQAVSLYDETSRKKAGWHASDVDLLHDPYRIFSASRHDTEAVQLQIVDRGIFPDDSVRAVHPLEAPSQLESAIDIRRVRAFSIQALEEAAASGHTLHFLPELADAIRESSAQPTCPVTADFLGANLEGFKPEIVSIETGGKTALQLVRYDQHRTLIRKNVLDRVAGKRHAGGPDWAVLLEKRFGKNADGEEVRARHEKREALKELFESRFSVLAGPAGAGKTTVLGILCEQKEIRDGGILLLAPTGKARVRMQQLAGEAGTDAKTIAQFLNQNGRYDGKTGRYFISDRPKTTGFATVIVDEASMLTEDMLGAVIDALHGVKRLILVGDPAQLPPIGAGRPFVDIVAQLRPDNVENRFPRIASGYAELTIERRQIGTDRPDVRLARWFSAGGPSAGEDDIFEAGDASFPSIGFVQWDDPKDLQTKLLQVIAAELDLENVDDVRGFNRALGSVSQGEYDYFNATRHGKIGSVEAAEAWQVLSPVRSLPFGVSDVNRLIHERFRRGFLELATRHRRPIPKPLGGERIVYGDKIINLSNHRRDGRRVYPQEGALGYLANGEIGIAVGMWKTNGFPKILKIEFSSQPGFTYDFYGSDFREEGDAALELAYALTVHKAQGSQFGRVILILPADHPIMSRELIYTALTRHQKRVVIMHQGQRSSLKAFASPHRSETARRRTCLLNDCVMLEYPQPKGSVFLQEGLIHRSSRGLPLRSKSELLIVEALYAAGVNFEYEKPLTLGGVTRYPDFTIENEISGKTIYWEHLGMLDREEYQVSWKRKLAWYLSHGIQPFEAGRQSDTTLVTTADTPQIGLDMSLVKKLISEAVH